MTAHPFLTRLITWLTLAGVISVAIQPWQITWARTKAQDSQASTQTPTDDNPDLTNWWNQDINASGTPSSSGQVAPRGTSPQPSEFMKRPETDQEQQSRRQQLDLPTPVAHPIELTPTLAPSSNQPTINPPQVPTKTAPTDASLKQQANQPKPEAPHEKKHRKQHEQTPSETKSQPTSINQTAPAPVDAVKSTNPNAQAPNTSNQPEVKHSDKQDRHSRGHRQAAPVQEKQATPQPSQAPAQLPTTLDQPEQPAATIQPQTKPAQEHHKKQKTEKQHPATQPQPASSQTNQAQTEKPAIEQTPAQSAVPAPSKPEKVKKQKHPREHQKPDIKHTTPPVIQASPTDAGNAIAPAQMPDASKQAQTPSATEQAGTQATEPLKKSRKKQRNPKTHQPKPKKASTQPGTSEAAPQSTPVAMPLDSSPLNTSEQSKSSKADDTPAKEKQRRKKKNSTQPGAGWMQTSPVQAAPSAKQHEKTTPQPVASSSAPQDQSNKPKPVQASKQELKRQRAEAKAAKRAEEQALKHAKMEAEKAAKAAETAKRSEMEAAKLAATHAKEEAIKAARAADVAKRAEADKQAKLAAQKRKQAEAEKRIAAEAEKRAKAEADKRAKEASVQQAKVEAAKRVEAEKQAKLAREMQHKQARQKTKPGSMPSQDMTLSPNAPAATTTASPVVTEQPTLQSSQVKREGQSKPAKKHKKSQPEIKPAAPMGTGTNANPTPETPAASQVAPAAQPAPITESQPANAQSIPDKPADSQPGNTQKSNKKPKKVKTKHNKATVPTSQPTQPVENNPATQAPEPKTVTPAKVTTQGHLPLVPPQEPVQIQQAPAPSTTIPSNEPSAPNDNAPSSTPVEVTTPSDSAIPPDTSQPATPPVADASPALNTVPQQKAALYADMLDHWMKSPKPQSFEPVLNQGQEAAAAILRAMDSMDDATFNALRQKMQGYLMVRDEVMVVAPDPKFFIEPMKKHGRAADIAFFELMNQTLNGYWPTTMEQRTDLSGCTRFGSGELVKLYGAWSNFQKHYPGAYQKALQDPNLPLLSDIEDQLVNSHAACDGPNSVVDELKTFIARYPNTRLTPKIQQRLKNLEHSQFDMTFYQGVKYNTER